MSHDVYMENSIVCFEGDWLVYLNVSFVHFIIL